MTTCTLCGTTIDIMETIEHVEEHVQKTIKVDCRVSYDLVFDELDPRIIVHLLPLI